MDSSVYWTSLRKESVNLKVCQQKLPKLYTNTKMGLKTQKIIFKSCSMISNSLTSMYLENQKERKRIWSRKNIWSNNGQEFSKVNDMN